MPEIGLVQLAQKVMKHRKKKIALIIALSVFALGFAIPENLLIPVDGATAADWNRESFWYEPWGKSGVHKGIDIFSAKGTALLSSSRGLVVYAGNIEMGGNVVIVLGPKWRIHYYAHLDTINASILNVVSAGDVIGTVGDSGNAKGKPPHLHYSIITMVPYIWRADSSTQGWKKMFFLDPGEKLSG